MKKQFNDFANRCPFGPLWVFCGGGTAIFFSVYFIPQPCAWIPAVVGLLLLVLFVCFLIFCRSEDRVAIGTAGPATIGPLLAHLYVKYRAPALEPVLKGDGDMLIQLAFFFASLFGAAVYIFVVFGEKPSRYSPHKNRTCFIIFGLVLLGISLIDLTNSSALIQGPPLAFGIEAPPLTSLTLCRLGLALLSVILATWPKSAQELPKEAAGVGISDRNKHDLA